MADWFVDLEKRNPGLDGFNNRPRRPQKLFRVLFDPDTIPEAYAICLGCWHKFFVNPRTEEGLYLDYQKVLRHECRQCGLRERSGKEIEFVYEEGQ